MLTQILEKLSITRQLYLLSAIGVIGTSAIVASYQLVPGSTTVIWGVSIATFFLLIFVATVMGQHISRRTELIVKALHALAEGDLSQKCAISGRDEFAWLSWEYSCARKTFSQMVSEIIDNADVLSTAADQLSSVTEKGKHLVSNQNARTEQVATAMNEMSTTINEIARNASNAAESASLADAEAVKGNRMMKETIGTINTLADQVERTFVFISKLKDESDGIGAVLDVIRGIAEQTNLLALNAAIEAARAGEQGRGFAVVADEVRTLASRTQESTQEIQEMIERLQSGANDAVTVMEEGRKRAEISVTQSAEAGESIASINQVVDNIKDLNMQIATAAEEQSATAEEINQSVVAITNIAMDTSVGADQSARATEELVKLANRLRSMVGNFKIAAM